MIRFLTLGLISFITLAPLAGCGFQPLHGQGTYGAQDVKIGDHFALIDISNIPDREGQYLRNALIDRFHIYGTPARAAYRLHVSRLDETLVDLDITKLSDSTRGQLRLKTNVALYAADSGELLLERRLQSITSYNILASEFSTRVSEDNARLNAIDNLAQQIETHLGLYFSRH